MDLNTLLQNQAAYLRSIDRKFCCLLNSIDDTPSSGDGSVTSVTSANNAHATVATSTTTPVITIVSAPKLTTARTIYGNSFDGTAALSQIISSVYGGTGNGFTKFTGATTSEKTYTLPNATCTILTTNAAVTVAQGGTGLATLTTAYGLLAAGTTATGTVQTLATGTSGQILRSAGSAAIPTWSTATFPATAGTIGNVLMSDGTNFVSSAIPTDLTLTPKSSNFNITSSDGNKVFICTNAITATVVTAGMSAGFNCVIVQKGASQITVASSDTLLEPDGYTKTEKQYTAISILYLGGGEILIGGRTGA